MHRSAVLMISVVVALGLGSCSGDEQTATTTPDQTTMPAPATVAVDDTTTDGVTTPTSAAATSTVTVTVTDIEGAVGSELVGLVFAADQPNPRFVVGGFGVAVDDDPFETTQVVRAPRPDLSSGSFFPEEDWPYVSEDAVLLAPGEYLLLLWLGEPPLCCYSAPWVPAASSTLRGCTTEFTVAGAGPAEVTVSGVPGRPGDGYGAGTECSAG